MFENLIGYQLIEFNPMYFRVKKDDIVKTFLFEEDGGDCCGYNEFTLQLLIDENDLKNNPIITKVETCNFDNDGYEDFDHRKITFYGLYKPIEEIDSTSSSGSGWGYGACVTCKCVETNEEETITSW